MTAPTGKGGRRQPPRSARPRNGRPRCSVRPASGPPGIRLHFWGAGPRREPGLGGADVEQAGGAPLRAPAGSSPRGRVGGRGAAIPRGSAGLGWRSAPGVGGARGAGVNVRPAPAALTQFHQKPEEEAEPQRTRHRGGSGGRSRAGSRGPEPLQARPHPTHLRR